MGLNIEIPKYEKISIFLRIISLINKYYIVQILNIINQSIKYNQLNIIKYNQYNLKVLKK